MKNLLIVAYACEPGKGSEPGVGWHMSNELAKILPNTTIHVITKKNNKNSIEKEKYPSNLRFHYYAPPSWMTFWKKGQRGIRTYYYLWMIWGTLFIWRKKIPFDIIHHITFVNDWMPSHFILLKLKGAKFIWGPIGSNDPIEKKFLYTSSNHIFRYSKSILQIILRNFDPFFYICKKYADCIIGTNQRVKEKLSLGDTVCFITEPAIAIENSLVEKTLFHKKSDKFLILSVGKLIHIKNFKLTILAFEKFLKKSQAKDSLLQIIGSGEDEKFLKELVKHLDIEKFVEFQNEIPLQQVYEKFSKAHLFIFPTLENAGFVILEAMSHALPVLALNYGGPKQFVLHNKDLQLVSPELPYEQIVEELSNRILYLYSNEQKRFDIGEINRHDVLEYFTWEKKALKMKRLYEKLLKD